MPKRNKYTWLKKKKKSAANKYKQVLLPASVSVAPEIPARFGANPANARFLSGRMKWREGRWWVGVVEGHKRRKVRERGGACYSTCIWFLTIRKNKKQTLSWCLSVHFLLRPQEPKMFIQAVPQHIWSELQGQLQVSNQVFLAGHLFS